jgi:ABC-2 type transport system permease protein
LEILKDEPDESLYQGPPRIVALLLEGSFPSFYRNRMPPEIAQSPEIGFIEQGEPGRMIMVSDGDVIKNQLRIGQGTPLPLGYDQYTGEMFGNRDFILNAVNYLCDESGLISIRSRELKLRLLDRTRLNSERLTWQLSNTLLPLLLIAVFGWIFHLTRKRRYTK